MAHQSALLVDHVKVPRLLLLSVPDSIAILLANNIATDFDHHSVPVMSVSSLISSSNLSHTEGDQSSIYT